MIIMAKDKENKKADNKGKKMDKVKASLGISVTKDEDFSEWYTQVINRAELIEYTDVSGCVVLRPYSYAMWESIVAHMDKLIKQRGVENAYFPLFIPEKNLMRESEHVDGFTPEVAWVTHSGDTKLSEKLAVRPTSETIMYPAYAKWIRSHRDLPLKINQWNNVVRWEFKNPMPFLRTREFLWQEGHTAFATKQESEDEVRDILENVYAKTIMDLMAVPVMLGTKSTKEKFAGALYTTSGEVILPNKKAIQGFTSHCLGQNFSKAFDISFFDENKEKKYVWQNSWGFTTRTIGIMIMMHSDDKGLVLPPKIAPIQVVIVPIIFKDSKDRVMKKIAEIEKELGKNFRIRIDDREECSPGFKFNEWELKGVPVRLELGPKDLENGHVMMARRDNGEKKAVKFADIKDTIKAELEDMQVSLLKKAQKYIDDNIVEVDEMGEMIEAIEDKKIAYAAFCDDPECEDWIKDKTGGAKSLNSPFSQDAKKLDSKRCIQCGKPAKAMFYFGKSW